MLPEQKELFREELAKKVSHFQKHPQMRPFIGDDYDKTRLFILGESHYLKEADYWRIKIWYNSSVDEWLPKGFTEDQSNWPGWYGDTHTALLVTKKMHSIYSRMDAVLRACEGVKELRSGLEGCAYMNFFQRPAEINGGSIHNKGLDDIYAAQTLQGVCEVLKPTRIYFASTRAYKGLGTFINQKQLQVTMATSPFPFENVGRIKGWFNDALIGHGAHPASQWWNKAAKSYSKPRSQKAITGAQSLRCFAQFQP